MINKARLKRLEDRANVKSEPDVLWRQYSKLSDEVESRLQARFTPEEMEEYKRWLAGFCWDGFDNDDDRKIKDRLYAKYADDEDLKALEQLDEINRKYMIATSGKAQLKEFYSWLDDEVIDRLHELIKAGKMTEADEIIESTWDSLPESQADEILEKWL